MPSSISKSRLQKAFNEGRRSASAKTVENPYDNPKLRKLWEQGRTMQQAGEIKTPIPALEHGETRAQRAIQNPPAPKRPLVRAHDRHDRRRFDGRGQRGR